MSIDRIGGPGLDEDVEKPEPAQAPAPDSRRPRRSVNEEFLDAMDDGRIIGRDDSHEPDGGGARFETSRSSDAGAARPSAADTSRVWKPVNEEFLDAMDEGRVIGRDDARELERGGGGQGLDTDETSESDGNRTGTSTGYERETVVIDERVRHDETDAQSGTDIVLLGGDSEAPSEDDPPGNGNVEQKKEDDSADETSADSNAEKQDPSTDGALGTIGEPVMRSPEGWDGPTAEVRRGDDLYPGARTSFATTTGMDPNTCYRVEGRGNFYTDDSGTIVRAEMPYGAKGNLNWDLNRPQPNMTYVVTPDVNNPLDGFDYRHEFTTDDKGRVVEAKTDSLAFGEATRSESVQRRIGKLGGEDFEGGHLFAKWFGGGPESLNLVPMHWEFNRGSGDSWANLENRWAQQLRKEPPVVITEVTLEPHYPGEDSIPKAITVSWYEGDELFERRFTKNG